MRLLGWGLPMTEPQQPALLEDGRRSIDLRYLNRPAKVIRPHYFPFVLGAAGKWLGSQAAPSVCELGCANGAFAAYLLEALPHVRLTGVDILLELVECARVEAPKGSFSVGNVVRRDTLPAGPFDAVFMLTIHSLFDEPSIWLDSVQALLAPGGRAYIFGLFNPVPVDVRVRMRDRRADTEWLPGWSQVSEYTMGELLDARCLDYRFTRYEPVDERSPDPVDSLRSYTIASADGGLVYVNGGQLLHQFALLELTNS